MQLPDIPSIALRNFQPVVNTIADIPGDGSSAAIHGTPKDIRLLQDVIKLKKLWIVAATEITCHAISALENLEELTLFKPKLSDLQSVPPLPSLRTLTIIASPTLKSLTGLESLQTLTTLILFANCNFNDITPLASLKNLHSLCLEGGFSKTLKIKSLQPLSNLTSLTILRLASVCVEDKSLHPLHPLTNLQKIFICNSFPTPEWKSLAAALPHTQGEFLNSYRHHK